MSAAKVLVLMTSPLDKIVHALRVVDSIKRQRPALEVTWVARRFFAPLVSSFDCVDRTLEFRRRAAFSSFVRLVREIRRERYDYVLDFEGHARTGAMCFLSRAVRKIGLSTAREGATVCYSEVIHPRVQIEGHLIDQLQAFGSAFGVDGAVQGTLKLAKNFGLPESLESSSRFVCLFPGRFKEQRAWPGFGELARWLVERDEGLQVLLLGMTRGVGELPLHDRIVDLQERLQWGQICELVAKAELVVANDNGPAQLAGALGCRNLTLFSFVSPSMRGSYPLEQRGNGVLVAPGGAVSQLPPNAVFRAVEKLLDR